MDRDSIVQVNDATRAASWWSQKNEELGFTILPLHWSAREKELPAEINARSPGISTLSANPAICQRKDSQGTSVITRRYSIGNFAAMSRALPFFAAFGGLPATQLPGDGRACRPMREGLHRWEPCGDVDRSLTESRRPHRSPPPHPLGGAIPQLWRGPAGFRRRTPHRSHSSQETVPCP